MNTEITERNGGWALYDGNCAFCRAWVARGYRVLRRRGFKLAALQAPWVQTRFGLKAETLLNEMRLITADGRNLGGADALIEIARSIWWMSPVSTLARLPGAMAVLRATYRWFAARRHCFGGACQLPHKGSRRSPNHSVTSSFYEMP